MPEDDLVFISEVICGASYNKLPKTGRWLTAVYLIVVLALLGGAVYVGLGPLLWGLFTVFFVPLAVLEIIYFFIFHRHRGTHVSVDRQGKILIKNVPVRKILKPTLHHFSHLCFIFPINPIPYLFHVWSTRIGFQAGYLETTINNIKSVEVVPERYHEDFSNEQAARDYYNYYRKSFLGLNPRNGLYAIRKMVGENYPYFSKFLFIADETKPIIKIVFKELVVDQGFIIKTPVSEFSLYVNIETAETAMRILKSST